MVPSCIARAEATATYTPPTPTTVSGVFNFERLTPDDLLEIVGTKLAATRRRLLVLDDIPIPDNTNQAHAAAVDHLRQRLHTLFIISSMPLVLRTDATAGVRMQSLEALTENSISWNLMSND